MAWRYTASQIIALLLAILHVLAGILSVTSGFVASVQADVWMAYSVCPIWTGSVFVVTGIMGLLAIRRRTLYLILCYIALSITSTIMAAVSIQLLRLGLVNQTSDGKAYAKEQKDTLILIALGDSAFEILFCFITIGIAWKVSAQVKEEMKKRHEGTFYVQVVGEKEILVVNNPNSRTHSAPPMGASLLASNIDPGGISAVSAPASAAMGTVRRPILPQQPRQQQETTSFINQPGPSTAASLKGPPPGGGGGGSTSKTSTPKR